MGNTLAAGQKRPASPETPGATAAGRSLIAGTPSLRFSATNVFFPVFGGDKAPTAPLLMLTGSMAALLAPGLETGQQGTHSPGGPLARLLQKQLGASLPAPRMYLLFLTIGSTA